MRQSVLWTWIYGGLLVIIALAVGLVLMWQVTRSRTPAATAEAFFRAEYRREYARAWNFISSDDRAYKTRAQYLAENPPAAGNQSVLLARLADRAEFTLVSIVSTFEDHAVVMTRVRIPDLEDPALVQLLDAAVVTDRASLLAQLDALHASDQIPYVEEDRVFSLVYDDGAWGVVLHWGGAVTVRLTAAVSPDLPWEFYPVQAEIQAVPGETVQVIYRVKNLADHPLTGKARHEVQSTPDGYRSYFETIQCFCFTEQTLAAGEEKDMPLIFRVDFTVPPGVTEFTNGYTFYPLETFPGDAQPTLVP